MLVAVASLLPLLAALPGALAYDRCGARPTDEASTVPTSSSSNAEASGLPPVLLAPRKNISLDHSFLYELDKNPIGSPIMTSSSGVEVNSNVYITDLDRSTEDEITGYKADGKTVICYFPAGTWDGERDDADQFDPACVCDGASFVDKKCSTLDNMQGQWGQWWLDIHSDSCKASVQNVMETRIKRAKGKGCQGIDPDNVDSYTNVQEQKHGNTQQDQVNYNLFLAQTAHDNGLFIGLKNANDLLRGDEYKDIIVDAFDFSVIEKCHQYNECEVYEPFINAGKPMFMIEYGDFPTCPSLKKGQHLLVYSEDHLDTSLITLVCNA